MIGAEDCIQAKVPVQENDIIIAGSDGIFDNMTDQEMKEFLLKNLQQQVKLQDIVKGFVEQCWNNSVNKFYVSPFQQEANRYGFKHSGGKTDDCTAVLTRIEKVL